MFLLRKLKGDNENKLASLLFEGKETEPEETADAFKVSRRAFLTLLNRPVLQIPSVNRFRFS